MLNKTTNMFLLLITGIFLCQTVAGQLSGPVFSGTLRTGSTPNAVVVSIRPSASFTGKFTNIHFTLQLPDNILPRPDVSINNNFLTAYLPTANFTTAYSHEEGYYNYLFSINTDQSPTYSFISGVQTDLLEISFINAPLGVVAYSRLGHLNDGGLLTGQMSFYTEISGNDNTDYTNMFYGTGASNHGNYNGYSFVPVQNIVVPLSTISLTATLVNNNALLRWDVINQKDNIISYEAQRSIDGIHFENIANKAPNPSHTYEAIDNQLNLIISEGYAYYRIKETDADNNCKYSAVRSIQVNPMELISIYPVPASEEINISFISNRKTNNWIEIMDSEGRTVLKARKEISKGSNVIILDIHALSKGNYLIRMQGLSDTWKFVKM